MTSTKLFFDLDGVLVRCKHPQGGFMWAKEIESALGVKLEIVDQLFQQPRWNEIICGKGDFRSLVESEFNSLGISELATRFIEYWLSHDLNWHANIVDKLSHFKEHGCELYLATNQDLIRTRYLSNQKIVSDHFKKIYTSCGLGVCKPNPLFFEKIMDDLDEGTEHKCIFIDDSAQNVAAAKLCGFDVVHFQPDVESDHTGDYLLKVLMDILYKITA